MGTILLVLLGIIVVVFGIAKYIKSKSTPIIKARVINKPVNKTDFKTALEDTKDKAIKKYNASKKN